MKKIIAIMCFSIAGVFFLPYVSFASSCAGVVDSTTGGNLGVGYAGSGNGYAWATPFTPAGNCALNASSVSVYVSNAGIGYSGSVFPAIYSGSPPSTQICLGQALSGVTGSVADVVSGFSSQCNLVGGTQYYFALVPSGSSSSSNYLQWYGSNVNFNLYADSHFASSWVSEASYTPDPSFLLTNTAGGGGSSATSTPPASEIFASSTLSESPVATYEIVDNPTQDFFMGYAVMMSSLCFMVWFFRRKN